MSRAFFGRRGVIFKFGLLGDDGEERRRGAPGPVHPGLPLADGLLAGPQAPGKFPLRQAQVPAQGLYPPAVPGGPSDGRMLAHVRNIHDTGTGRQTGGNPALLMSFELSRGPEGMARRQAFAE
jgi:hypothetical protein